MKTAKHLVGWSGLVLTAIGVLWAPSDDSGAAALLLLAGGALLALWLVIVGFQLVDRLLGREIEGTVQAVVGDRKPCPDCAKGVPAAARVCSHCGFRFEPAP